MEAYQWFGRHTAYPQTESASKLKYLRNISVRSTKRCCQWPRLLSLLYPRFKVPKCTRISFLGPVEPIFRVHFEKTEHRSGALRQKSKNRSSKPRIGCAGALGDFVQGMRRNTPPQRPVNPST